MKRMAVSTLAKSSSCKNSVGCRRPLRSRRSSLSCETVLTILHFIQESLGKLQYLPAGMNTSSGPTEFGRVALAGTIEHEPGARACLWFISYRDTTTAWRTLFISGTTQAISKLQSRIAPRFGTKVIATALPPLATIALRWCACLADARCARAPSETSAARAAACASRA